MPRGRVFANNKNGGTSAHSGRDHKFCPQLKLSHKGTKYIIQGPTFFFSAVSQIFPPNRIVSFKGGWGSQVGKGDFDKSFILKIFPIFFSSFLSLKLFPIFLSSFLLAS